MLFKLVSDVLRGKQSRGARQLIVDAQTAFAAEDFERAASLLNEAWRAGAADADALHLLGKASKRLGQDENARNAIAAALRQEFGLPQGDDPATAAALADLLWREPPVRWWHRVQEIERLGRHFSRSGGYARWGADLLERLSRYEPAQLAPGRDENTVFATLRLLEFDSKAASAWVEQVFARLVLPWMQRALVADRFAVALLLETHAYGYYVLREENEERFRRSFSLWMDDMRQAGRRAAERLKPLPAPARQDASGVAFYLQSGSILAHTRLLLDFLEAHAALQRPMIRPFVFLRGKAHPELSSRLSAIGVPCCELEAQVGDGQAAYFDCLLALRGHIAEERIAAVVWVSVAVHMAFAFALRVAPVQIWWALKYHSLELPEADGYLTSGSAGSIKLVGGRPWRSSPLASDDWYRPQLAARAAEVRAQYAQHDLLFACLGRTEKMNSESFLAAVAEILRACPRAGFLWTGRDRSPEIQRRFEQLGVAKRCHFIGWVDTKLYAQVLDIFLDSFPFPCGFTLYEAMAAGKPVVAYASTEAAETGLHGLLGPLLAGQTGTAAEQEAARGMFSESLYSCASDPAHYVALALRLGGNSDLRARAGDAHRKFVGAFLSDRERMARTLGTHLVEIIDQAGPR